MLLFFLFLWVFPYANAQISIGGGVAFAGGPTSVKSYGAKGDALRTTCSTTANSAVISCGAASFTSADIGKYMEILGSGPGGVSGTTGTIAANSLNFSDSSASFVSTQVGMYLRIHNGNQSGTDYISQVLAVPSATQLTLGCKPVVAMSFCSGSGPLLSFSGNAAYVLEGSTGEGFIQSVQSGTQVTLDAAQSYTVNSSTAWYGTNDSAAFNSAILAACTAGGGTVFVPATGPLAGYMVAPPHPITVNSYSISLYCPQTGSNLSTYPIALIGDPTKPLLIGRGAWSNAAGSLVRGPLIKNMGGTGAGPTTIANLILEGATDGNTWQHNYAMVSTPDGWDLSDKCISSSAYSLTVTGVTCQNFKGEELYAGAINSATISYVSMLNTNGDNMSMGAVNTDVKNSTFFSAAADNAENAVFDFSTSSSYIGNTFSWGNFGADILGAASDNIYNPGPIILSDNYFDSVVNSCIYLPAQSTPGSVPPANVSIRDNKFHDCGTGISFSTFLGYDIENNVFVTDQKNGGIYMILPSRGSGATISNNYGYSTSYAVANNIAPNTPFSAYTQLAFDAPGVAVMSNVIVKNNVFQSTGNYFQVPSGVASSSFASGSQYLNLQGNKCIGCTPAASFGLYYYTSGQTLSPWLDLMTIGFGGSGPFSPLDFSIDTTYAQDGQVVTIAAVSNPVNQFRFSSDSNLALPYPLMITSGARATFRFNGVIGKWGLVSVEGVTQPGCQVFNIAGSQLTAAATSQTLTLFALSANATIQSLFLKTATAFSGSGISAISATIGDSVGGASFYTSSTYDMFAAVGNTNFQNNSPGLGLLKTQASAAGSNVQITVTANQNLNAATITGSLNVTACYAYH